MNLCHWLSSFKTPQLGNQRYGSKRGGPTDKGGGREDDSQFCILFCICQIGGAADEEGGKGDDWVGAGLHLQLPAAVS